MRQSVYSKGETMNDLSTPIDEATLAFLDVETTGLDPDHGHRVCEIAVQQCRGETVIGELQQLVNPGRPMSPGAFAVNGISDQMLRDEPTFDKVFDRVLAFTSGAVLIGHNLPFDVGFLDAEFRFLGLAWPRSAMLDTLPMARRLYHLPRNSLDVLVEALELRVEARAHRALGDVLRTRALFNRLVSDLWPRGVRTLGDYVQIQGGELSYRKAPDLPMPPTIAEALQGKYLLKLRYLDAYGGVTERIVRPISIADRGGNLVLVAYCHLRDAERSFRLDRILEMELVR